jgi:hypothetical protein
VYEVEDLSSGRVTSIHASRLQFYSDASLDVSTDLLAHIAHNNQGFDVRDLLDVRYDAESKSYCVLVSWLGFENADNTGEPLANLLQDIPHLVSRFLDKISDQDLAAALREECNLTNPMAPKSPFPGEEMWRLHHHGVRYSCKPVSILALRLYSP